MEAYTEGRGRVEMGVGAEKRSKAERMEGGKEDVKEALHRLMNRNPDSSAVLLSL